LPRKNKHSDLPPLLRVRRAPNESPEVAAQRFQQLLNFCDAAKEAQQFLAHPEGSKEAMFWHLAMYASIARGLLRHFVKAYEPPKQRSISVEDWMKAGGAPMYVSEASPHFYQAQLAQLIHRLDGEHKKGRDWVFRWLANEEAVTTGKAAERRLAMLPARYKRLRTSGSIRVAYNRIPKHVRANPEAHLPLRISNLARALAGLSLLE
jgi:hypothetical protein